MSLGVDFSNLGTLLAVGAAPTIAVVTSSWLAGRSARRAERAAREQAAANAQAQLGILQAQADAAKAQAQAAEAATQLVKTAQTTSTRLDELRKVADGTHAIVNNQRTVMLRLVADLRRQIAQQNPDSQEAKDAAAMAEREAQEAERAQNVGIGGARPPTETL